MQRLEDPQSQPQLEDCSALKRLNLHRGIPYSVEVVTILLDLVLLIPNTPALNLNLTQPILTQLILTDDNSEEDYEAESKYRGPDSNSFIFKEEI